MTASTAAAPVGWRVGPPLADREYFDVRRRTIFECCKWDPQVEDVSTLARFPLILAADCWRELGSLAEALARETLAAETELLERPELHAALALPWRVRRALARARTSGASAGAARLIRFDFHHTVDGWRISEANSDVPGGINEASGFAALIAEHHPGAAPVGDPAAAYASALVAAARSHRPALCESPACPAGDGAPATLALVHATAYSDDRQVMTYLARRIEALGARAVLAGPADLDWRGGRALLHPGDGASAIDLIVRFFPGEWLPNLPRRARWSRFIEGAHTPISNPATALLTQSKRFPLVWDALRTPLPAWRALLPETRDTRAIRLGDDGWVIKPALGRVGEDIAVPGVTTAKEWRRIVRDVRLHRRHWVAQRRFEPTPLDAGDHLAFPCVGVYTVGTRAVGAYGRLARRPLTDWRAQDIAVLVARDETPGDGSPVVAPAAGAGYIRHADLTVRRRTG